MLPAVQEEQGSEPQRHKWNVPKDWHNYWDHCRDLEVPERGGVFCVYETGVKEAPGLLLIHGGGYTALTWSVMVKHLKDRYHLWALDMRGHGKSSFQNEGDLSAETLTEDIVALWDCLQKEDGVSKRPLVMVGHSMGAAIAVRAAATGRMACLEGIVVIDVVEGTALASLPYMRTVIKKRPASFSTLELAVEWALATKMCKKEESASISVPSMLVAADQEWQWRTPLLSSEPYWTEWYQGLSQLFLSLSVPKLLCLAGTDRLDKMLTVGQMQGKFQLALMPTAGHAIHEDDPHHVANLLTQFITKFRVGQTPLPFLNRN